MWTSDEPDAEVFDELDTPSADEVLEIGPSKFVAVFTGETVCGWECVRIRERPDGVVGWAFEER